MAQKTDQQGLFGEPAGSPPETNTLPKDWIDETVGALFDPIIVFPAGGWENELPEMLKKELPLRRLAHLMLCSQGKAHWDEACDTEACLYLYPASLAAPMSEHWGNIYLYLGTKCLGECLPEEARHEKLDSYEQGLLRDLKRWIYQKKVSARKAKAHREKAAQQPAEPEPVAVKYEQAKMF